MEIVKTEQLKTPPQPHTTQKREDSNKGYESSTLYIFSSLSSREVV